MFGDTIQIFDSYRILKEEEELLAVWLYDVQLYVGLQSVSWILAEFCYNRSPQGPYTITCTILQETINEFLCPLIVFRKM